MKDIGSITMRLVALALAAGVAAPAMAADRWEVAARGAVAILPSPVESSRIIGGSLFCAEQKWGLLLRTEPDAVAGSLNAPASIEIGRQSFPSTAVLSGSTIGIDVPIEILEPVKAANRMAVVIGEGDDALKAEFPLRGSRAVVEVIAPLCSQVDMSGYQPVSLLQSDANLAAANELTADERKLFRASTGRDAELLATTLDLPYGKALLFASLCGSTSYYGPSGCTLAGYARMSPSGEWQEAYWTEGVHLYLDSDAVNGGFPDLMTLPVVNGLQPTRWSWTGTEYAVGGAVVANQGNIGD